MVRLEDGVFVVLPGDVLGTIDATTTFMEGGGLAVEGGLGLVPTLISVVQRFPENQRVRTEDIHPPGHICRLDSYDGVDPVTALTIDSIADWTEDDNPIVSTAFDLAYLRAHLPETREGVQIVWPVHGDPGSGEEHTHPDITAFPHVLVLGKGLDPRCDSYSGARDNLGRSTGLIEWLRARGTKRVFLQGIAFNFCVGWTAFDLAEAGFEVFVIWDGTVSVPIPGTVEAMVERLVGVNVKFITADQVEAA